MLEKVLTYIHNWFEQSRHAGTWDVEGGTFSVPFLQEGQYFRVVGSVFNDGLHQYPDTEMKDESFTGEIWALAIPRQVIDLAAEIEEWVDANKKVLDSPYSSESFGGYSYTKSSDLSTDNGGVVLSGWQSAFNSRLIPWRKLY